MVSTQRDSGVGWTRQEGGAAECCQLTVEECAREGTLVGVGVRHLSLEWEVSQTKSGLCPVDRGKLREAA